MKARTNAMKSVRQRQRIIRVNVTFWFNEAQTSEAEIKDRLDRMLVEGFADLPNWHTRWVADLADSPLLGAATQPLFGAATQRAKRSDSRRPRIPVTDPMRRPTEVMKMIGASESTLYRLVRRGSFPAPVQITSKLIGWPQSVVEKWIKNRRRGRERSAA